jgi:integrase
VKLLDKHGQRKYLNLKERKAFKIASERQPREIRTFCLVLYYTGCRISEALELTYESIDLKEHTIIFECLKKRKNGVFRAVPVPSSFNDILDLVHGLSEAKLNRQSKKLWSWSRMTAYRKIKSVMEAAGLSGIKATPRGLRHAFGIACNQKGIQLNMVQKWLGHADIRTTAIYSDAVGRRPSGLMPS